MIHVIVSVELTEGRRDDFLAEFHRIVPQVLDEPGCISYGPTIDAVTEIEAQSTSGDDVVTIVEKWQSLADLQNHLVAPHMLEYRPRVRDMIQASRLQILQDA
jgi:quinol monooxygenase YgiN